MWNVPHATDVVAAIPSRELDLHALRRCLVLLVAVAELTIRHRRASAGVPR